MVTQIIRKGSKPVACRFLDIKLQAQKDMDFRASNSFGVRECAISCKVVTQF